MKKNRLTKQQILLLLSNRLGCSLEALTFLFNAETSTSHNAESLIIPESRLN